jgi:hypothetical protein
VFAWGFAVELIVGGTAATVARYLPYTAAAMMAGVATGGGMPHLAASSRSRSPPPPASWPTPPS